MLDPGSGRYWIRTASEVTAASGGTMTDLTGEPYRASMRLTGFPTREIRFNGRGEGNEGGIVVITAGGLEAAVVIEPTNGRAYVAGKGG